MAKLKERWFAHRINEGDAPADTGVAASRETGGIAGHDPTGDAQSTTGTGKNQTFVGRPAGDDDGYTGRTGAEARAEEKE
ncbi:hypothetical protein [Kribbella amoyensis]|uniref:hypothetical protein n=1 Tax=Kribbella amoyensis TaxID=996641 RepID=UPI0011A03367|nr:hypothetical protein [Kribbella amoyensis]